MRFLAACLMGLLAAPLFAQVKIDAEKLPLVLPPRDATHIKNRFRIAVLGPEALHDE